MLGECLLVLHPSLVSAIETKAVMESNRFQNEISNGLASPTSQLSANLNF
jgi:hypothetical protein